MKLRPGLYRIAYQKEPSGDIIFPNYDLISNMEDLNWNINLLKREANVGDELIFLFRLTNIKIKTEKIERVEYDYKVK